jgi:hypothetical protein
MFNIIQPDEICTAFLPGPANARQTSALAPSSINICYLFNCTSFYLDWAIVRQKKHVLTENPMNNIVINKSFFHEV